MQYQTFRGSDLREALDAVKAAFGPDALISSTAHVTNGRTGVLGKSYVEVTAAPPGGAPRVWGFGLEANHAQVDRAKKRVQTRAPGVRPRSENSGGAAGLGLDIAEVEKELATLRQMLEALTATRPPRERALAMLQAAGVEGALARELVVGAPKSLKSQSALRSWLAKRLAGRLRVEPGLITRDGPQVIACVGPTGVGKTTTLAKLAARARLDHGRAVRVISLDTFRVGAVEQWQRYAKLLGLPFHAVSEVDNLRQILSQCGSELVLIDTAGRGAHDSDSDWALPRGLSHVGNRSLHVLLVLPAWLRAHDAEQVAERYRQLGTTGVVLSKLDETTLRGGVLHATLPTGLPIAYLCDGPRVPEDVCDATMDAVLTAVFPSES